MKNFKTLMRIFFGVFLLFFGLNGFLQFMPMPEVGPQAGAFLGALASTKLFFPVISVVEIIVGALLIVNKAVPLVLIIIFPILVCAVLFHLSLDPAGILFAIIGLVLNILLLITNQEKYLPLIKL
tara:strand:- start:687 stop:1061 length:375 start_codon:yes stop_codon:yes gene_type:complete